MRFPFPPASAQEFASPPDRCEPGETQLPAADLVKTAAVVADSPGPVAEKPPELPLDAQPPTTNLVLDTAEAPSLSADPVSEPEPRYERPAVPRPPAKRKVIAFPRQATLAPETYHRLADPVVPEQPRILDVPEELEAFPCAPLLDGLQLPSHVAQNATPADHVDLPFQAVSISHRLLAGLIDCALVAVSTAVFGAVCYKMLPKLTLSKPLLVIAATMPLVFWAAYQYLLTMYGGATVGMRTLRMRLSTFKGGMPNWRHRRSRVVGLYFSAASLMMGLLWALVDVDALCWHDRISRTYLAKQEQKPSATA